MITYEFDLATHRVKKLNGTAYSFLPHLMGNGCEISTCDEAAEVILHDWRGMQYAAKYWRSLGIMIRDHIAEHNMPYTITSVGLSVAALAEPEAPFVPSAVLR